MNESVGEISPRVAVCIDRKSPVRWRYSGVRYRGTGCGARSFSGFVHATEADIAAELALDEAAPEGCTGLTPHFGYWPSGGWIMHLTSSGDSISLVVILDEEGQPE